MNSWHRYDWFAFFQAIGSVVAIFAAGGIASYQGRAARRLAKDLQMEKGAATASALRSLLDQMDTIYIFTIDTLKSPRGDIQALHVTANSEAIPALRQGLLSIPLSDFPGPKHAAICVEAITMASALQRNLLDALTAGQLNRNERWAEIAKRVENSRVHLTELRWEMAK